MLFRNPKALAFLMFAVGIGLLGYFGEQWYRLPKWSEAEIEQSVELNLAIDLNRMGPHLRPTGEKLERLRGIIRAEVEGEIRREREQLERWMGAGLLLLVLGAGQWAALALAIKKGAEKPRP
jgi:hypothetical protein